MDAVDGRVVRRRAQLAAAEAQVASLTAQQAQLSAQIGQARTQQAVTVRTSPEPQRQLISTAVGLRRSLEQAQAEQPGRPRSRSGWPRRSAWRAPGATRASPSWSLLAVGGRLTAGRLGLHAPVYDPARHYGSTRERWQELGSAP